MFKYFQIHIFEVFTLVFAFAYLFWNTFQFVFIFAFKKAQIYIADVNDGTDGAVNGNDTLNVIVDVVQRFHGLDGLENASHTNVSEIVVDSKSTTSVHLLNDGSNSRVKGALTGSSDSSLEMDEVEIIIDLNSYHEARKIEAIDERLRNIVMHMIPTTRKAYVDDICDGIKGLLDVTELEQVRSPIDLPNQVIKFVQKRYVDL